MSVDYLLHESSVGYGVWSPLTIATARTDILTGFQS